jgi:hypothetical protein
MPIGLVELATTVVTSFLAPWAKDGAKKLAEKVGEKMGEAAATRVVETSKKIWDRVKDAFSSGDDLITLNLLENFKADPETWEKPVQKKLQEKLEQDSALAEELDKLVNAAGADGKSGNVQIKDVVGDVGVLYMPGANFQGAKDVRLAGVVKEYKPGQGNVAKVNKTDQGEDPAPSSKPSALQLEDVFERGGPASPGSPSKK